ncbi:hypothetical protein FK516_31035, partial [Klebsiella pneumoniae]|nr:hypothetical protein [Klebsiella pneumoniae]
MELAAITQAADMLDALTYLPILPAKTCQAQGMISFSLLGKEDAHGLLSFFLPLLLGQGDIKNIYIYTY